MSRAGLLEECRIHAISVLLSALFNVKSICSLSQRGRDIGSVLEQYNRHVKPAFDHYIAPSMVHADIIVPRGGENEVH